MLGSKLRNWMENHILKPRKKSNKNKNSAASNVAETYLITTNSTAKDYAFNNSELNNQKKSQYNKKKNNCIPISYNLTYNASNASPASASSALNSTSNTNPSGITNGNSVIASPVRRREISPIQNSNLRRYGWLSPKLEYGIHEATQPYIFNSDGHIFDRARENPVESNAIVEGHRSCCDQQQQKEFLIQHQLNYSTSSCSSPTWSTGSKDTFLLRSNQTQGLEKSKQAKAGTILTQSNDYQNNDSITTGGSDYLANDLIKQKNCENFETIVRQTKKLLNKHDLLQDCHRERPKSEQFYPSQRHAGKSSPGYGRLLPSKLANSMLSNFPSGSEKCSSHNSLHTKSTLPPYHCLSVLHPTFTPSTASYNSLSDYKITSTSGITSIEEATSNACVENICGNISNDLIGNNSGQTLISLSSPESAYSTGYSTDGTSQNVPYSASEIHSNGRKSHNHHSKSINSMVVEGQRYKFGLNKIEEMSPLDPLPKTSFMQTSNEYNEGHEPVNSYQILNNNLTNRIEMKNPNNSLAEQQQFMLAAYQSSSPRQRCRIRTNPWISTIDPLIVNDGFIGHNQTNTQQNRSNSKKIHENSTIRRDNHQTKLLDVNCLSVSPITYNSNNNTHAVYKHSCGYYADNLLSLNHTDDKFKGELIDKFVQNYSYEKETDILSNESDLTDHQLSIDTGLDAGDECDSEDARELIDASLNTSLINSVRRKRYLKTCKKNSKERNYQKIRENRKSRETRSAGGTPVCLRKHTSQAERHNGFKARYISERANSMIFDDEKINQNLFMSMDDDDDDDIDDEIILSKADLEADMKYRQLIIEAEILLVTMGHSMQSLNQKALSSPCKANERRRMIQKSQSELDRHPKQNKLHKSQCLLKDLSGVSLADGKIRTLKSSRNSKDYRISLCSPQRTHLTNFLNQNNSSTDFKISNRITNRHFNRFSSKENDT